MCELSSYSLLFFTPASAMDAKSECVCTERIVWPFDVPLHLGPSSLCCILPTQGSSMAHLTSVCLCKNAPVQVQSSSYTLGHKSCSFYYSYQKGLFFSELKTTEDETVEWHHRLSGHESE